MDCPRSPVEGARGPHLTLQPGLGNGSHTGLMSLTQASQTGARCSLSLPPCVSCVFICRRRDTLWTGVRNHRGKSIPSHPVREEIALNSWGLVAISRAPTPGHSVAHEAPLMGAGWQTQAYRSLFVPTLVVAGGSLAQGAALAWSPPFPGDTGKSTRMALSSVKAGWR